MLDVCALELAAVGLIWLRRLLVRTALSSVFVEALLTGMPLNIKVHSRAAIFSSGHNVMRPTRRTLFIFAQLRTAVFMCALLRFYIMYI